jgi:hypothetical protein
MRDQVPPVALWARVALVVLAAVVLFFLNDVSVSSGFRSTQGFPMTFLVTRTRVERPDLTLSSKTEVIWGSLVADIAVWIGVAGLLWYVTRPPR